MSGVSIKFRPVTNQWNYVDGSNKFHDAINHLFGMPCKLTDKDIARLQGVYACGFKGAQELIDAISECGEIELKAEY